MLRGETERGVLEPVLDLLRDLAGEVPVAAFAERVLRFREAVGDQGEEVARLALRIQGTLATRRRRENALAVLGETAADLTSMRDVGAVLLAIVRRARRLVETDAGYLTLVDAVGDGGLYTRVTDGIASPDFREAPAIGIGRWVMETGSAQRTSDYFADQRFTHARRADEVVAAEGLVAILAVPVSLHGEVIGILSVADRAHREFGPPEVDLLTSLASHAGVAIENARLFEAAEQTLEKLTAATAEAQRAREAAEQAAEMHTRLTRVVLDGGGVTEVVAATAEAMGRPVQAFDETGRKLAAAGDGEVTWPTEVVAGSERLGLLVVGGARPVAAELRLVERAAQVTALVLLQHRVVFEAEHRTRSDLLRDLLLVTPADEHIVAERSRRFGVDPDAPTVVVVADWSGPSRERLLLACDALAPRFGVVTAEHDGHLVLLLPTGSKNVTAGRAARPPGDDARSEADDGAGRHAPETAGTAIADEFLAVLERRTNGRLLAGVSGPARSLSGIRNAHRKASRCLALLHALDRTQGVARESELGVYGLLLATADPTAVADFVDDQLGLLLEYDRRTGTTLVATLRGWFAAGQNMQRAASALHVHVNTLYQRFERIDRLIGRQWREPEASLSLQLAVRLHTLRRVEG